MMEFSSRSVLLHCRLVNFLLLCTIKSTTGGLIRGPWEAWGSCSTKCNGEQTRTRECVADGEETCQGQITQTRACSKDHCPTLPIIISIILGVLILLAAGLLFIMIRKKLRQENNEKSKFNVNAAEEYYDRSIKGSTYRSYFGDYPSTSRSFHGDYVSSYAPSIASSRATIPTIAPYLPNLEEEADYHVHEDNDSSLGNTKEAAVY